MHTWGYGKDEGPQKRKKRENFQNFEIKNATPKVGYPTPLKVFLNNMSPLPRIFEKTSHTLPLWIFNPNASIYNRIKDVLELGN